MAEIRLSRHARADLDEIWTYIARDKSDAADRFVELLVSKFPLLADHPDLGRSRPELAAEVRSFPVKNYLILYRSRTGLLEIVRVVSGYRDLKGLFR
jgi:toxin ParE1/3/4